MYFCSLNILESTYKTEPGPLPSSSLPSVTIFTSVKSKMVAKNKNKQKICARGRGGGGGGGIGGAPYKRKWGKKLYKNIYKKNTLCKG